ncbi:heterochromatin protein 1-binding protein 3 isoform X2 [Hemibagrus wyckioides]|uniref:heterochromatin protein 1-binding protein 3 isoform X2 n=1 Tax=Hemibagrus wyckioides TaxID=337641 RepID=UPI00266D40E8|nr:heterochromatin protein 1-binding protein 3 isoform X2 [Hemibagrus wyckioides]
MPIRRSAAAPPKEDTPPAPEPEVKTNSGESTSAEEEQKGAPAATPAGEESGDAGEKSAENAPEDGEKGEAGEAAEGEKSEKSGGTEEQGKKKKKKDAAKKPEEKEGGEEKSKKVKRKIPAWATMSASKLACAPKSVSVSQPKVEEILLDAIQNCKERSGASIFTIMKYVTKKYSSMEMDKRTKSQYKRAMKKLVEKGLVKQLKGKGFSGSFTIGKLPSESNSKKPSTSSFSGTKGGTLGEALPLIMTRLCEPKEASYILIKKYLEQHFPQLNVESRPDILKNCLQRSVERGFLEQITGKGASGTFQLKKSGNKVLLGGGLLEDAIVAAITAMNEPKCCSISVLRKFLVENHQDKTAYFIVANLKRTLQRCKMMGWMEQITGHGLSGSYQLSYPFYPSPDVLFPEMMEKIKQKEKEKLKQQKRRRDEESDDEEEEEEEEEESEEEESEDEEPPPRKRSQKRPAPRKRQPPPRKKPKTTSRKPAPARRPAAPAKKTSASDNKAVSKKIPPPPKATPVKKAAPARKPKTPIAKKMTSRVSKRPTPKKTPAKKQETSSESKSAARKSLRARK